MKKILLNTLLVALVSFLLNFAWEHLHVVLYTDFPAHVNGMPILLWSSIGDAFYTTLLYLGLSLINRDAEWFKKMDFKDYSLVTLVSLLTAVGIEINALTKGKWAYLDSMPIVPFFNVGLSPFVQLAILSMITFLLVTMCQKAVRHMSDKWRT